MSRINPYFLFVLILLIVAGGGVLSEFLFERDANIIILGFRINIPLLIGSALVIWAEGERYLKEILSWREHNKTGLILFFVLLIYGVITGALMQFTKSKFTEPDYFYELGLSSIIDFPVYLVWNMPILISLAGILGYFRKRLKASYIFGFILLLLILLTEYYPFNFKGIVPEKQIIVPAFILLTLTIFYKVRNTYLYGGILFSAVWINVILFGTNSATVTKLIIAKNFDKWDGFIILAKEFTDYVQPAAFILITIVLLFFKKKKPEENSSTN